MGSAPIRVDFGRDRGLQFRMVATMVALVVVYAAFGVAIVFAGATAWIALVVMTVVAIFQIGLSDKLALKAVGAREVSPAEAPQLHAVVDRLCVQADLPKPRLAWSDTEVPNAFAIGRSPRNALVCVTRGLVDRLTPSELEAVVAHELAHVKSRDVMVMTIASFVATVALLMLKLGHISIRMFFFAIMIGAATWAFGKLLLLALSRHREFAADRTAALLTGRPSALASALVKVAGGMAATPSDDLRAARRLTAFFIVADERRGFLDRMLATHPPLRSRIDALAQMEQSMHHRSFDADLLLAAENFDECEPVAMPAQAAAFAPQQAAATPAQQPAGWHADPWRTARLRYWDGRAWTGYTSQ
jgi:heat shock protein HtpX